MTNVQHSLPEPLVGQGDELMTQLRVLVDQRWTVLAVAAVALVAATLVTLRQRPKYEAVATVLIEPTAPKVLANVAEVKDLGSVQDSHAYYQTQYRILHSDTLLGDVIRRAQVNVPEGADPVLWLGERLTIDPIRESQLVNVRVVDSDPAQAMMLANLVSDVYIEQNVTHKLEATKSAVSWLEVQLEDLKSNLHKSEVALSDFKRSNNIISVSIEDRQSLVAQQLESLGHALNDTRIKRLGLEAEMDDPQAPKDGAGAASEIPEVVQNPAIQILLDKRSEARQELAELEGRYLPGHPQYARVSSRLAAIDKAIQERSSEISAGLTRELDSARRLESALSSAIGASKQQALDLNQKSLDYSRIEREYETNKSLHGMVLTRLKETNLTGLLETNNIRVLDRAKLPKKPISPNVGLNLAVGLLLGLALGVLSAFALNRLDDTIKNQSEIELASGLAFLGLIPTTKENPPAGRRNEANPDLFVHRNPSSLAAEYCRGIRSNLLFMSPDQPMRSMVVSSAEEGAGKTATVIKLATLLSQTGARTLVVDADMRRPRLHKVFNLPNETGLSSIITGADQADQLIRTTEIAGVDVLTSGYVPPNPAELLHSQRFVEILAELKQRYRFILFDSPPLLNVTDAMILGRAVDGLVLVARAGQTNRSAFNRVVEQLSDVHVRIFGTILNDYDLEKRARAYYRDVGAYVRQYGNVG